MPEWTGRPHTALLLGQEEDRFTAYLAELLRDERFREDFLRRLCGVDVTAAEVPSVRTQVVVPDGRPDLVLSGPRHHLVFEAKVGSWLHGSQLSAYARMLAAWQRERPDGVGRLYLLTPAGVAEAQRGQGVRELAGAGVELEGGVTAVSWQSVAALCKEAAPRAGARLGVHLEAFAELVEERLGAVTEPFTAEEVALLDDPTVPLVLERLLHVVNLTKEVLAADADLRLSSSSGMGSHGYIVRHGELAWWFGLWYPRWAAGLGAPLGLTLPGATAHVALQLPEGLRSPVQVRRREGLEQAVPLPVVSGVRLGELAARHAETVRRYCTEVPESGTGSW